MVAVPLALETLVLLHYVFMSSCIRLGRFNPGAMVYSDVGLLTDDDVKTMFNGLTAKDLGLRSVTVCTEKEAAPSKMWVIGLKGMPEGLASSIRKLRTFYKAAVYHDKVWLPREEQLHKEQAASTWAWQLSAEKEGRAVKSRTGLADYASCARLAAADEESREQDKRFLTSNL